MATSERMWGLVSVWCQGQCSSSVSVHTRVFMRVLCPQCRVPWQVSALSAQCSRSALKSQCTQCKVLSDLCVSLSLEECSLHCVWCGVGLSDVAAIVWALVLGDCGSDRRSAKGAVRLVCVHACV